jgi:hypothetical protein
MPFGFTECPSHNRKIPDNKIAFHVPQTVSENMATLNGSDMAMCLNRYYSFELGR